jgi:integrase
MSDTTRPKLPKGVYYHRDGFRAYAAISHAKEDREDLTFPKGTKLSAIVAWQEATRTKLREVDKPKPGSLVAELPRYFTLKRAEGMSPKACAKREVELRAAFAHLGPNRTRAEIGYEQIIDTLAKLKTAGRTNPRTRAGKRGGQVNAGGRVAKELKNGTIRCYKNALQNFWTVLGGRSAANPVKDVLLKKQFPELKRQKPPVISHALLDKILAAMPDVGGPAIKGHRRSETNLTRIRLRLIAFCGLPQEQIRELEPDDIDWAERMIFTGRNKGLGLEGEWREMGDFGMDALRDFAEARAFTTYAGAFSSSSMYKSFCLARDKVAPGSTVTPYKLRHLFANTSLDAGADEKSASRITLHGSEATSRIYRETAERKRDRRAWDAIDRWHRKQGRTLKHAQTGLHAGIARNGIRAVK